MDRVAPDSSTEFLPFQKLTVKEVMTGLGSRDATEAALTDPLARIDRPAIDNADICCESTEPVAGDQLQGESYVRAHRAMDTAALAAPASAAIRRRHIERQIERGPAILPAVRRMPIRIVIVRAEAIGARQRATERRWIEHDLRRSKDQLRRRRAHCGAIPRAAAVGPYFPYAKSVYTHLDLAITEVRSSEEQHRHVDAQVVQLVWPVDIQVGNAGPDLQRSGYEAPIERDDPPKLRISIYADDVSSGPEQWDYAKAAGEDAEFDFPFRHAADKALGPTGANPRSRQFVAKGSVQP